MCPKFQPKLTSDIHRRHVTISWCISLTLCERLSLDTLILSHGCRVDVRTVDRETLLIELLAGGDAYSSMRKYEIIGQSLNHSCFSVATSDKSYATSPSIPFVKSGHHTFQLKRVMSSNGRIG